MALTKCKECGKEVSTKAEACPHCGAKVGAKQFGCGSSILVVFLGLIILGAITSIIDPGSSSPSQKHGAAITQKKPKKVVPPKPGSQWKYSSYSDDMGEGNVYAARVRSSNTVNFDFPYSGAQRGTLTLRTHPRHGKDVIFQIEKGQILCNSYEKCSVLVRFGESPATTYSASPAADNSRDVIFIRNYSAFAKNMLGTDKLRISIEVYQEGNPVFEFDVSHFSVEKYRPGQ